jgi:hypothetical protein
MHPVSSPVSGGLHCIATSGYHLKTLRVSGANGYSARLITALFHDSGKPATTPLSIPIR